MEDEEDKRRGKRGEAKEVKGERKEGSGRGRRMKRKEREEKVGTEKEKGLKIAFWNVAGLKSKDRRFWKSLEEWEVLVLTETWIERKKWGKIKDKLPTGYDWKFQETKRRNKKGRAMRGIISVSKRIW